MSNTISTTYLGNGANTYTTFSAVVELDTYASGGVAIPFGGFTPVMVVGCECVSGTTTYTPIFDLANKKIKLFSAIGTEQAAGSITKSTFHVTFLGSLA